MQDSLATSYVLVEPLVDDLSEGGFSGLVEVVLGDSDGYIVLDAGAVAGVLERRGEVYSRTTLERLAADSRLERGRVSIYTYTRPVARLLAGRINAQTLYSGLNAVSADPRKLIRKLALETEREWFVEINARSGLSALIHISGGRCRVLSSGAAANGVEAESVEVTEDEALGKLLDEYRRAGATFDVCYSRAGATREAELEPVDIGLPAESSSYSQETLPNADVGPPGLVTHAPGEPDEPAGIDSSLGPTLDAEPAPAAAAAVIEGETGDEAGAAIEPCEPDSAGHVFEPVAPGDATLESLAEDLKSLAGEDLIPELDEPGAPAHPGGLPEVRALMAEIARTIEEAAQSVGRPDSFSMSLRAGLIRVAEQYPFLDPFGGEFEYLSGEIVFIGEATAEEFVAGLSEALGLALQGVMRSSRYPERFRAYVAEDLRKLLARKTAAIESSGLDRVIGGLIHQSELAAAR